MKLVVRADVDRAVVQVGETELDRDEAVGLIAEISHALLALRPDQHPPLRRAQDLR